MTEIYFHKVINRHKEIAFFKYLSSHINEYKHINRNYVLNSYLVDKTIDIIQLISKLELNTTLTNLKRSRLIGQLKLLPQSIKVIKSINDISVDFVIKSNDKLQFIEFHEKQHRNLSDKRPKLVFTNDFKEIEVPRFVQRFLKDYWRLENLSNYKIVWWDWFEKNNNYTNLVDENKKEYYLPNKFSFEELLTNTAGNNAYKK